MNTNGWKWRTPGPIAVGCVIALLVACAPSAPAAQPTAARPEPTDAPAPTLAPNPNVLTIALPTSISALELPYASETNSQNVSRTLYDSLLYQAPDGSIQPALAESWEVTNGGKSYTFRLRKDVTFHNGEPFNADAVVLTWNTYRQEQVPYSAYFTPAETVEKIDDYTVQVTTRAPNALLLPSIALAWTLLPPKYYQEVGARAFAEHPVGTGPYVLQEWARDDHLTLRANPGYWRQGRPLIDTVVFKFIPESAGRVAALRKGEVDIALRLSPAEAQSVQGVPGIRVIRYPVDRVYYVAFNNIYGNNTAILDRRVRLAMNYAVDRRGIVKGLLDGSAQLAAGFVGPADVGWDGAEPFPYDPDRAKQLLVEAGYPDGFATEMACPNRAYSHINEVCEAVVRYLDKVGIQVDLNLIESNSFWERQKNKQLPALFVDSWASYYRDAYNRLAGALTPGESWASWRDPKLQEMIVEIGRTLDLKTRETLYHKLQAMMRDDPPFIYLYFPETFEGVRSRVVGYQPRPGEDYYLWDVRLDSSK